MPRLIAALCLGTVSTAPGLTLITAPAAAQVAKSGYQEVADEPYSDPEHLEGIEDRFRQYQRALRQAAFAKDRESMRKLLEKLRELEGDHRRITGHSTGNLVRQAAQYARLRQFYENDLRELDANANNRQMERPTLGSNGKPVERGYREIANEAYRDPRNPEETVQRIATYKAALREADIQKDLESIEKLVQKMAEIERFEYRNRVILTELGSSPESITGDIKERLSEIDRNLSSIENSLIFYDWAYDDTEEKAPNSRPKTVRVPPPVAQAANSRDPEGKSYQPFAIRPFSPPYSVAVPETAEHYAQALDEAVRKRDRVAGVAIRRNILQLYAHTNGLVADALAETGDPSSPSVLQAEEYERTVYGVIERRSYGGPGHWVEAYPELEEFGKLKTPARLSEERRQQNQQPALQEKQQQQQQDGLPEFNPSGPMIFPPEPQQTRGAIFYLPNTGGDEHSPASMPSGSLRTNDPVFNLRLGYSNAQVANTGTGFQRAGVLGEAPEEFALKSKARIDTWGGEAGMRWGKLSFSLGYAEGKGRTSGSIPANSGVTTGIPYGTFSPGGSTGIATGDVAMLDSTTETDVSRLSFGAAYDLFESGEAFADTARFVLSGYVGVELNDIDIKTSSTGTGTVEGFAFRYDQARAHNFKERTYGLGIRMEYAMPLAQKLGLKLAVESGPYLFDFKRETTEINKANFILAPDNDFSLNSTESDSGVGLRAHAMLKLEYDFGGGFTVGAAGTYAWRSDGLGVFVPNSGDQVLAGQTTRLRREERDEFGVGLVLEIPFGGSESRRRGGRPGGARP